MKKYKKGLAITYLLLGHSLYAEVSEDKGVIHKADKVIEQSKFDNIAAAKQASIVFTAANYLVEVKQLKRAKHYFHAGLQLDPWNMDQQLSYAWLLTRMKDDKQAASVARVVFENTERQELLQRSSKICNLPMPSGVLQLPEKAITKVCFCFVKIGSVDEWLIQSSGKMLSDALGSPVYVHPQTINLPKPHRSFYDRWVKSVKKDIQWEHPFVLEQMKKLNINSSELASIDEVLEIVARILETQGEGNHRGKLQLAKEQAMEQDRQWDAEKLFLQLSRVIPERKNVVYIGITNGDMFGGNNSFTFGIGHAASRRGLVSYARFSASFNNERENKKRLLTRVHKQLLSSIGFALGIPRPIDPKSVRSYSNSLPAHDQKGIWLSEQCKKGFEKALGHKLPEKVRHIRRK